MYTAGMKRRAVIFGYPVCVVWPSMLAGVVLVIVLCGVLFGVAMMALDGVMQNVHQSDESGGFFRWYWLTVAVLFVAWWWLSGSSRRFYRRLKKLDGRVCLVCTREIAAGESVCSGCGAEWSLDGLGKRWTRAAKGS